MFFGLFVTNTKEEKSNALFSKICDDMYKDIKAYAFRLTKGNKYLAEEITQNTFECAKIEQETLLSHPDIQGWLYKTAKNYYHREISKNNKVNKNEEELSQELFVPENLHSDSALRREFALRREQDENVFENISEKLFSKLSKKEKNIIIYKYQYNISLKEISELLNENYSKIRQIHYRALRKLKNQLKDESDYKK